MLQRLSTIWWQWWHLKQIIPVLQWLHKCPSSFSWRNLFWYSNLDGQLLSRTALLNPRTLCTEIRVRHMLSYQHRAFWYPSFLVQKCSDKTNYGIQAFHYFPYSIPHSSSDIESTFNCWLTSFPKEVCAISAGCTLSIAARIELAAFKIWVFADHAALGDHTINFCQYYTC